MPKPIKRHSILQPISREHHHGLLLCWKIKTGLAKEVDLERIKNYVNWFWESHLRDHFEFEEKFMFPILDKESKNLERALEEHAKLKSFFTATDNIEQNLRSIVDVLDTHIRFEERVLFNEIQALSTKEDLDKIEKAHATNLIDEWEDNFWE